MTYMVVEYVENFSDRIIFSAIILRLRPLSIFFANHLYNASFTVQ